MKLQLKYTKVSRFDRFFNGVQLIETFDEVIIYNDPFSSQPVYITHDIDNNLVVFSDFQDFYPLGAEDRLIDPVGFWEIVLLGNALGTRTLYKSLLQLPSASKLTIKKSTKSYKISHYWNYEVYEDPNIASITSAADGLYDLLNDIFAEIDHNANYLMGLSAGLDSRISLSFLAKYLTSNSLDLFTYGFDPRILEYQLAIRVSNFFGFPAPRFHLLSERSYREAIGYLPKASGGQIGPNHCHVIDALRGDTRSNVIQISNYYSDAILGWSCLPEKDLIADNSREQEIFDVWGIEPWIRDEIFDDLRSSLSRWQKESNFSCAGEFRYVSDRNPRFHMLLASIQNSFVPTMLPYANRVLLEYILSVPIRFRAKKGLADALLSDRYIGGGIANLTSVSSRDFRKEARGFGERRAFLRATNWLHFKAINRINAVLWWAGKGKFELFNPYQTEAQVRELRKNFHNDLKNATAKLVRRGVLTPSQKNKWDRIPLRGRGITQRFCLIGLSEIV